MNNKDLAAEYQALRAANDQLRERGTKWLWQTLDALTAEINRALPAGPEGAPIQMIQIALQPAWQFNVETAVMVGERYGARLRGRTLVVEAGWPRSPEHGFLSDGGLARARIGVSQNTILAAQPIEELILKRHGAADVAWFLIRQRQLGEQLTSARLEQHLRSLLRD
jgi:hypothetical protein